MASLIPRDFLSFPRLRLPLLWDELREDLEEMRVGMMVVPRGMSIYEDDKNVFVEATVAGVDPKDVEVTFDKDNRTLWIRAEVKKEEGEEKRKYYHRQVRTHSYQVMLPSSVDTSKDPDVSYRNGLLVAKFAKSPAMQPKKIPVKIAG